MEAAETDRLIITSKSSPDPTLGPVQALANLSPAEALVRQVNRGAPIGVIASWTTRHGSTPFRVMEILLS